MTIVQVKFTAISVSSSQYALDAFLETGLVTPPLVTLGAQENLPQIVAVYAQGQEVSFPNGPIRGMHVRVAFGAPLQQADAYGTVALNVAQDGIQAGQQIRVVGMPPGQRFFEGSESLPHQTT